MRFSYNSVDTVTELMQKSDYMSTLDIQDAYRAIVIHPHDSRRQGFAWRFTGEGRVMYLRDDRLCIGLYGPYILSKVSDFVVRCGYGRDLLGSSTT